MLPGVVDVPKNDPEVNSTSHIAETIRDNMSEEIGVLCFSSKGDVPAMWAHYAANHSGVCFVFDPSVLPKGALRKVSYSKDRPTLSLKNFEDGTESEETTRILNEALFSKSDSWSYEDEYRIIVSIGDDEEFTEGFPLWDGFLKRIIVGMKCNYTLGNFRSILNASSFEDVEIQFARMHDTKYRVDTCDYLRVDMEGILPNEIEKIRVRVEEALHERLAKPQGAKEADDNKPGQAST